MPEDDTLPTAEATEEHDGAFTQTAHDPLPLLFMCCHPSLSSESRVALTLKQVSQLSVPEIARLLGAEPAAVAQRLVRAKRSLQSQRESFVVPADVDLPARLGDVLLVCYALFTAGHLHTTDDATDEASRCVEALRLVEMLRRWPPTAQPATHALAALCWFTMARQPARFVNGAVVRGYDRLLDIAPSPAARLARVVSLAHAGRHTDALAALDSMQRDTSFPASLTAEWHATAATIAMFRGEPTESAMAFERALASWTDQAQQHGERHHEAVRAFWTTRLAEARHSADRTPASADSHSPSTVRPQETTPGGPAL